MVYIRDHMPIPDYIVIDQNSKFIEIQARTTFWNEDYLDITFACSVCKACSTIYSKLCFNSDIARFPLPQRPCTGQDTPNSGLTLETTFQEDQSNQGRSQAFQYTGFVVGD
jgi:hypothetical protein